MVGRAPKFLGALKVVPKLVASDRKIGRSWMQATLSSTKRYHVVQNVAQTGLIKHGEIKAELYSHWFTYSSKI